MVYLTMGILNKIITVLAFINIVLVIRNKNIFYFHKNEYNILSNKFYRFCIAIQTIYLIIIMIMSLYLPVSIITYAIIIYLLFEHIIKIIGLKMNYIKIRDRVR